MFGGKYDQINRDSYWWGGCSRSKLSNKSSRFGCLRRRLYGIWNTKRMARAAALEDPRFSRVTPSELPDIDFEISVLTPVREVKDINEIQVGRDGIIITRGYSKGLLLPQVATDYGWDRETFLAQTCRKAGLPMDAWKQEGTVIEMFSAEVFK